MEWTTLSSARFKSGRTPRPTSTPYTYTSTTSRYVIGCVFLSLTHSVSPISNHFSDLLMLAPFIHQIMGGCGPGHDVGEYYDTSADAAFESENCVVKFQMIDVYGRVLMHCHILKH